MESNGAPIKAAFTNLPGSELNALIDATKSAPLQAPSGLLAWLAAACDCELNRRKGRDYDLQPPEAAIPLEEDAASVNRAMAIRHMFGPGAHGVHGLFDVLL